MWNQSASSKIIQDRITQRSYDRHRRSLNHIRSTIDTSEPRRPHFIYTNYKEILKNNQRQHEIKSNNAILVQKMITQKIGNYHHLTNPVFGRQSLNKVTSGRQREKIVEDNKLIIRKLTEAKSTYNTRKILHQTNKHFEYKSNISQNARRCMSTRGFDESKSIF